MQKVACILAMVISITALILFATGKKEKPDNPDVRVKSVGVIDEDSKTKMLMMTTDKKDCVFYMQGKDYSNVIVKNDSITLSNPNAINERHNQINIGFDENDGGVIFKIGQPGPHQVKLNSAFLEHLSKMPLFFNGQNVIIKKLPVPHQVYRSKIDPRMSTLVTDFTKSFEGKRGKIVDMALPLGYKVEVQSLIIDNHLVELILLPEWLEQYGSSN